MYKTQMTKAEHARNLRYKRPALQSLGYDFITNELYDISSACADVQYFIDDDSETLINALDGDDEAAWEFKLAFADLMTKTDQLDEAFRDSDVQEHFDDCTVALIGNRYRTVGYDALEEDYYALSAFEQELAHTESGKKLMRKTKQEIISIVGQCVGITLAFFDIQHSFDYLKATFDILRDENTSLLKIIKEIETAYEEAAESNYGRSDKNKHFEALLGYLPDKVWLE